MSDETLLEEIRENFDDCVREWHDIREEARIDMQYQADGPWSKDERKEREAEKRPCIATDELGQYTNQAIGDMRQNKRAIKLTPKGNGATDVTAEKRAGIIREAEYKSHAQAAYACAFENMIKRSYGYWKVKADYCAPDSFDQELCIEAIPNPDTCFIDPYYKKIDCSDMDFAYLVDSFGEKPFHKRWPHAEVRSFEGEYLITAPAWFSGDRIQVAEYWRVEKKMREMLLVDIGDPTGPVKRYLDELPAGSKVQDSSVLVRLNGETHRVPLVNHRKTEDPLVCQYITNGIEILEKNPTKWPEVPIIAVFGPEEWVDDGTGSKRRLLSMVRKARDAYKSYCYIGTNEVEVIGMVPKVLYMGYEGQFSTRTPWDSVNKTALPYGEVKALTPATGSAVLPLPQRQLYDPPVEALEMAKASFRLAIQAAMGVSGLLNGQHAQNADAKSGKAIEALDRQESQGTYQFIANFERGIERTGRLMDGALEWVIDTPREVGSRALDETYSSVKVNQPDQDEQGQPTQFNTDDGDHGVTVSVGPNDDSEREAADDFVDGLMGMKGLPPKVMALAVRLKHLGPIGDEIAEAFDPEPQPNDPAVMAQNMQALQQKLATTEAFAQSLHEKIMTKQAELDVRVQIAEMQEETKRVLGLAAINSEEAQTKLEQELNIVHKKVDQNHAMVMEAIKHRNATSLQAGAQVADAGSQASKQAHEASQATQAQDAAAESQQSAQDAAAAQQEPKAS